MKEFKRILFQAVLTGVIAALFLCAFLSAANAAPLKITMLDVGQGDAVLIETTEQKILVDTSDADEFKKLDAELVQAGAYIFDKVILTHPHADHIGGVTKLFKEFRIKEIYDNGVISASPLQKKYYQGAQARLIPINHLYAGDVLDLGGGVVMEIYNPPELLVKGMNNGLQKANFNNSSIVGKVIYKNFSMLFTGDIEEEVEESLLTSGANLRSDILKAAHHGSKTSSTENFLRTVKPKFVLISAGKPFERGGNTYNHPHKDALKNYLLANVAKENVFWTYPNGRIIIETDGENFSVTPEKVFDWFDRKVGQRITVRVIDEA